jgi:hypothetical protein
MNLWPGWPGIQAKLPARLSEHCQHKSSGVFIAWQDNTTIF